jgi:hypothetical protein
MEETPKSKINISDYFVEGTISKVLRKLKLEGEDDPSIIRKIIFFVTLSWLPLLILTLIDSSALNTSIKIPLLLDFVIYVRVFIVLPLLFIAERMISAIIYKSLIHFIQSGIVADNNIEDYKLNLKFFGKLKDSVIVDIIIIAGSYAIVILGWGNVWKYYNLVAGYTTWQFSQTTEGSLSLSGYWYAFITIPVYLYFFIKLIWKFFLWAIVLFKLSRMKLNLYPTDPDGSGGLGFLGQTQIFFGLIGFIQSSIFSAEIAHKILYTNAAITEFKFTIPGFVVLAAFVLMSPMFFFIRKLSTTKLSGILDYGVIAHKYVSEFDDKWVKGNNPEGEKLLGSGDIQSLTDLASSYEIIKTMLPLPIDIRRILTLLLIIIVPFSPLILFVIPLNELLKALANFIF